MNKIQFGRADQKAARASLASRSAITGIIMYRAPRITACVLLMLVGGAANAHDLFVSFAKQTSGKSPGRTAIVSNGTFHESAGAVTRDRLRDVSMLQAGTKIKPDMAMWKVVGKQSQLTIRPAARGTYMLGVSTMTSSSTRSAVEFTEYLKLEDLPDTLATYDPAKFPKGVTYNYTKHARAIGQAGSLRTADYTASLGYPLEIGLKRNPASLKVGERVTFQVLHLQQPVPNLRVYVGSDAHLPGVGEHADATLVRTDENGEGSFDVTSAGTWYIHTNRMVPSERKGVDFDSERASLTFDIAARGRSR